MCGSRIFTGGWGLLEQDFADNEQDLGHKIGDPVVPPLDPHLLIIHTNAVLGVSCSCVLTCNLCLTLYARLGIWGKVGTGFCEVLYV